MEQGRCLVDFHGADFFPERGIDLVVVLRADNALLYSRLEARGYSQRKLEENVEAEIMQVILDEVRASYREQIIVELSSESLDALEANAARIATWIGQWCAQPQNAAAPAGGAAAML